MKYTYKISEHANSELYANLKRDIEYIYPEFEFEKEVKDADGSCTAFFKSTETGECIAAELSYANNNIVVTSDIRMVDLAEKYKTAPAEEKTNFIDFRQMLNAVLGTPLGIKAFLVPVVIIVLTFILNCVLRGGIDKYFIAEYLELLLGAALLIIVYGGGLMFIPSVLLSGWLAEKKNHYLYKVPLSAFMLFAELHMLIFYCYDLSFSGSDILQVSLFLLLGLPHMLLPLYIIMLPLIITDELAAKKHERICGKRITGWQSASWWSGTAAVMLAVFILFGAIVGGINSSKETELPVKETVNVHAAIDPLLDKYEDEMRTVSDYALSHDYFDWYCCPDESVRDEWEALFADDSEYVFDYTLGEHNERSFRVYIRNGEGKGFWTVGIDGENIYVNNELYNRTEGENEI